MAGHGPNLEVLHLGSEENQRGMYNLILLFLVARCLLSPIFSLFVLSLDDSNQQPSTSLTTNPKNKGRKYKKRSKQIDDDKLASLLRPLLPPSMQQTTSDRNCSNQRGKQPKSLTSWLKDRQDAGLGRIGSKLRAIIEFASTLPSSGAAIADEALLSIVKPFHLNVIEPFDLNYRNNLGIAALDANRDRILFVNLPRVDQLVKANILLDLFRRIALAYMAGHDGFQCNSKDEALEILANFLNYYENMHVKSDSSKSSLSVRKSSTSGRTELLKMFKMLHYNSETGRKLSADDITEVCPCYQGTFQAYIPGLHGGANGKVEATRISSGQVKVRPILTRPKGLIISDEGK